MASRTMRKPKRPLSAYNFFYKIERAKLLGLDVQEELEFERCGANHPAAKKARKHRKTPGMIGFCGLAKHVSEKWRRMDPKEKERYQKMFDDDRERYQQEMLQWTALQPSWPLDCKDWIGFCTSQSSPIGCSSSKEALSRSFMPPEDNKRARCSNSDLSSSHLSPILSGSRSPALSTGKSKFFDHEDASMLDYFDQNEALRRPDIWENSHPLKISQNESKIDAPTCSKIDSNFASDIDVKNHFLEPSTYETMRETVSELEDQLGALIDEEMRTFLMS